MMNSIHEIPQGVHFIDAMVLELLAAIRHVKENDEDVKNYVNQEIEKIKMKYLPTECFYSSDDNTDDEEDIKRSYQESVPSVLRSNVTKLMGCEGSKGDMCTSTTDFCDSDVLLPGMTPRELI